MAEHPSLPTHDDFEPGEGVLRDRIAMLEAALAEATACLNENTLRQQTLQEDQLSLEALLDNLPGMAYRCLNDAQWTMLVVSNGCAALTGYTPDELLYNRVVSFNDLIHPEDRPHVWETTQRSIAIGQPFTYTYRLRTRDGQEKWVWEQGCLVAQPNGQQVMEGFITDVTGQRLAQQALRQSQAQLQAMFDNAASAIALLDAQGHYLQVNERWHDMFGYDSLAGLASLDIIAPDDVSRTVRQYQALQTGELDAFQHEERYIRADGSEFWGLVSARAVRSADGLADRIVQTIVDITDRKNAETERLKLALEREKVNILAHFIEDASHEFRTPLAVIYTGLELIERALQPPPETAQRISAMKDQAMYIGKLIDDMLAMSHFDSGPMMMTTLLDINFLLRDLHAGFEAAAQAKNITLEFKPADGPAFIRASLPDLYRALEAIVQNALDFTASGGTVTLENVLARDTVTVRVADTGVGISADNLPRIFDRFFRANQARTGRHAGLGLTIARRIIELHSGEVRVTSEPGRGSVFHVVLSLGG